MSKSPRTATAELFSFGEKTTVEYNPRVYKIRWLILSMFMVYSASSSMQWIQYSIIANVIKEFYGVPSMAVDWTSMIYMILHIPSAFPASFLINKVGLRTTVIIGSVGTCLGSWIKVASVDPSLFWVTFLGQTVLALSEACVLSIPARLAAVWFGPEQVSTACSIGVLGNQLGCALGFLIPPMIVHAGPVHQVKKQLYILFISNGILTSIITVLILIFFKNNPPTPPSVAEARKMQKIENGANFKESLIRLLTNRNYILLAVSYAINVGIYCAVSTLLNQVILSYFPDGAADAGRIGLLIVIAGMIGSVVCGIVLDKTKKFKETTVVIYILSLIGMVIYTFIPKTQILVFYVVLTFLGFSMTGILPVGFEFASELTFPEPEGTSAGLLNASAQLFGVIITMIYSVLCNKLDFQWANSVLCLMLLVGVILNACIKSDLRRQAAADSFNVIINKTDEKQKILE